MRRSADISADGRYRYSLYRAWGQGGVVTWVMLNPSTADGTEDDPTIRRCIDFSERWGYGALWVVNLFAFRSTDPTVVKALYAVSPIEARGPENDKHVRMLCGSADKVICAWGNPGGKGTPSRDMLCLGGTWCLGKTKSGAPKHPLYLAKTTELVPFP